MFAMGISRHFFSFLFIIHRLIESSVVYVVWHGRTSPSSSSTYDMVRYTVHTITCNVLGQSTQQTISIKHRNKTLFIPTNRLTHEKWLFDVCSVWSMTTMDDGRWRLCVVKIHCAIDNTKVLLLDEWILLGSVVCVCFAVDVCWSDIALHVSCQTNDQYWRLSLFPLHTHISAKVEWDSTQYVTFHNEYDDVRSMYLTKFYGISSKISQSLGYIQALWGRVRWGKMWWITKLFSFVRITTIFFVFRSYTTLVVFAICHTSSSSAEVKIMKMNFCFVLPEFNPMWLMYSVLLVCDVKYW